MATTNWFSHLQMFKGWRTYTPAPRTKMKMENGGGHKVHFYEDTFWSPHTSLVCSQTHKPHPQPSTFRTCATNQRDWPRSVHTLPPVRTLFFVLCFPSTPHSPPTHTPPFPTLVSPSRLCDCPNNSVDTVGIHGGRHVTAGTMDQPLHASTLLIYVVLPLFFGQNWYELKNNWSDIFVFHSEARWHRPPTPHSKQTRQFQRDGCIRHTKHGTDIYHTSNAAPM